MPATFPARLVALAALILLLPTACDRRRDSATQAPTRVENLQLGIAIAALPAPFMVTLNRGDSLELTAPGAAGPGTMSLAVGPDTAAGINLVAEAEGSQEWFESQPEGQYFGNLELVTPIGSAFTARGSYRTETESVEELRVFLLHPAANRLLQIVYRYPPGEGQERMQQLLALLGELEAAVAGDQEASSSSSES